MIVATAGHVDHGKTSLIRCLTGVDTDRLEEERRRGLTITLGFAHMRTPAGSTIGFIDVPGHRRFINTMIAGIRGVDLGMLVVDAGEGVMPQTREHLQVMALLGVRDIVAVISKIDRVDPAQAGSVEQALHALLPDAPVFRVSNRSGAGIAALQAELAARADAEQHTQPRGYFRMSIDRAFVLKGSGLIVTGTALSGSVAPGDSLRLFTSRSADTGIPVRVRGIHVHDAAAASAHAGQRCAINLGGEVARDDITHGDMLCDARCLAPSERFDALLQIAADLPRPPHHLQTVKLYLGARRVPARILFLDDAAPDATVQERLVEFRLHDAVQVCNGDRFLIQDEAESGILGGGRVLNAAAPRSRKRDAGRLDRLRVLLTNDPVRMLERWLAQGTEPIDLREFALMLNLRDDELDALVARCTGTNVLRLRNANSDWLLMRDDWHARREHLLHRVDVWHEQHPQAWGIARALLLDKQLDDHAPLRFRQMLLDMLLDEGELEQSGGDIRRAGFEAAIPPAVTATWEVLEPYIRDRGFHLPLLSEIRRDLGLGTRTLTAVIAIAARDERLWRIGPKRVTLPDVLHEIAVQIRELGSTRKSFTVIDAKTHLGLGRDLTIEILEHLDAVGFTRRENNVRWLRDPAWPDTLPR